MAVFPNREEEREGRKRERERERQKIKLFKCTFAPLLSLGAHLQEETDAEVKRKGEALGCDHKSTSRTIIPAPPAYIAFKQTFDFGLLNVWLLRIKWDFPAVLTGIRGGKGNGEDAPMLASFFLACPPPPDLAINLHYTLSDLRVSDPQVNHYVPPPEFPVECQVVPVCGMTSISAAFHTHRPRRARVWCQSHLLCLDSCLTPLHPLSLFLQRGPLVNLDRTPGVIKTALPNMDREVKEQYQVLIQAKDMGGQLGGLAGTTTVNITLSDVNDNPPRFSKSKCRLPISTH